MGRITALMLLWGFLASGCVAPPYAAVGVRVAPPPARVEVVGVAPFPDAVWIRGHWVRRGDDWAWLHGHWRRPPAPDSYWIPGRWVPRGWGVRRHWVWLPGHWRR